MPGWRCSPDRTSLQANSLQTGNFSGNFAIPGLLERRPWQEIPVLQSFFHGFPTQANREEISKNREFLIRQQGTFASRARKSTVPVRGGPKRTASIVGGSSHWSATSLTPTTMRRVADRAGNPVACGEGGLRERAPEALADAGDQKVL